MKDQQISIFDINEICDFIEKQNGDIYHQFLVMLDEGFNKLPPSPNAMITRLTNDGATIHGMDNAVARNEGIHALPVRKGVYFFHILEVPGHVPNTPMETGKEFKAIAKVYIVMDFEKKTIVDATDKLKD
jgi:hypothetical protein